MDILCEEFVAVVTAVQPEMIWEGRSLLKQKRLVLKPVELSRTNRIVLVCVIPKTLVVMDIIVQLEDGSITAVEVQKYSYAFPGQRAACYSADMLLRQYKKKRDEASEAKRRMNYREIRPVYTIVLYENSPGIFHQFPDTYIHHFRQTSDTGLEMELQELDEGTIQYMIDELQEQLREKDDRLKEQDDRLKELRHRLQALENREGSDD